MSALCGNDIFNILKRCPVTSKIIRGIKTRDISIPNHPKNLPAAYVLNTGYANDGVHWVLVLCTASYNIFFDSFGRSPKELFLEGQVKCINSSILYNFKRMQHSKSSVCGHWVIYYAYFLCKGVPLNEITSKFS